MTRAIVLQNNRRVGRLIKHGESAYEFQYDADYLSEPGAHPISYSLPLKAEPYRSERLFPFFEGLIAEGWLRHQQSMIQKIDELDYFSLLIKNGQDLIGATSVIAAPENEKEL